MSYQTRRQYEVPKLVKVFDFESLLDSAIQAVKEIDAFYIEFLISFTYPNLEYIIAEEGMRGAAISCLGLGSEFFRLV